MLQRRPPGIARQVLARNDAWHRTFMTSTLPAIRDSALPFISDTTDFQADNLVYTAAGPVLVDPDNADYPRRVADFTHPAQPVVMCSAVWGGHFEVNRPDRACRRPRQERHHRCRGGRPRGHQRPGHRPAKSTDRAVEQILVRKVAKDSAAKARRQAISQLKAVLVDADPVLRESPGGMGTRADCPGHPRCWLGVLVRVGCLAQLGLDCFVGD